MKSLRLVSILLLAAGCFSKPRSSRVDLPNSVEMATVSYVVLSEPPDRELDEMDSKYLGDNKQWRKQWREDNASSSISGQSALNALELACYADITCHRVEYPLRVATLEYVKENLASSDVRNAIMWIRASYKSGLPLEEPGDEKGDFKGLRVEAMKIRMTEYASELLRPSVIAEGRK